MSKTFLSDIVRHLTDDANLQKKLHDDCRYAHKTKKIELSCDKVTGDYQVDEDEFFNWIIDHYYFFKDRKSGYFSPEKREIYQELRNNSPEEDRLLLPFTYNFGASYVIHADAKIPQFKTIEEAREIIQELANQKRDIEYSLTKKIKALEQELEEAKKKADRLDAINKRKGRRSGN